MSHDPSRKHFLAKLIGMLALTGLVTKVSARGRATGTTPRVKPAAAITLRPETRAVARRDQSL